MSQSPLSQKASIKDWLAVTGTSIGAFMAILDITMNNASLRDIQGTLGAGVDEASWIMTAYLIAEVIAIPMTGWLANVFSQRNYILFNVFIFIVFSMICGAARTLPIMIFARFFQGFSGGVLIPMAAGSVMARLPINQRNIGLALFSVATALAPALGPTFGGWITSNYGWQYSFYINLVPGLMVLALVYYSYPKTPMKLNMLRQGDWFGIAMMVLTLGTLTYILEEGNRKDWLGDSTILKCSIVCIVSFVLFVWVELKSKMPFIDLRLVMKTNFLLAIVAGALVGAFLLGNTYILPNYLVQLQGYNAYEVGKVLLWGGPVQIPFTLVVPFVIKRFGVQSIIAFGCVLFFMSSYVNSTITHSSGGDQFIWSQVLRAIGTSLVTGPLAGLAFSSVEIKYMASAVSIYSLLRTLGGSLAIASFGTFLSHRYIFHFSRIAEKITSTTPVVTEVLDRSAALYSSRSATPDVHALFSLGGLIRREAFTMAYADVFLVLALSMIPTFICIMLIRKPKSAVPVRDH